MNYEIIDPVTELALKIDPVKYVKVAYGRRGRWHIIDSSRDPMTTFCSERVSRYGNPEVRDKLHPSSKVCKRCEKANS